MEENRTPQTNLPEKPAPEQILPEQTAPEQPVPAAAEPETQINDQEQKPAAGAADMESIRTLAQELASIMTAATQPPQPTAEQKKQEAQAAARARRIKARRRRRKALKSLLIRTLVMLIVIYVLFFQIIGVTTMPTGDMYPRVDLGDMLLFYRLDKDVKAQEIIVFEKKTSDLNRYMEPEREANADAVQEDAEAEPGDLPAATPVPYVPDSVRRVNPLLTARDNSLWGRVKAFFHSAGEFLGMIRPEDSQTFVCRVVAVAGDTVEITAEGGLIVNGNHMIESNIFSPTTSYIGFTEYPITLYAGQCFVMADLRDGGADSRFFGPVYKDEILGTVITIMRRNNL